MSKEIKQPRKMRVVRAWLPNKQVFKYYTLYSDGTFDESNRREAEQYVAAYGAKLHTIVGEPTEAAWSSTGN